MSDGVVLTVRLIRSFEHRNIRHIVFKNVDLNQTTQEFMELINEGTIVWLGQLFNSGQSWRLAWFVWEIEGAVKHSPKETCRLNVQWEFPVRHLSTEMFKK